MGYIIAGLAVAAAGAGASAYGSSQQASASKDAAKLAAYMANQFGKQQQKELDELTKKKEERLRDVTNILEEYGGGPTAGSEENLGLLRKTQEDFLRLGAGDFEAFDAQLKDIMAATLANTIGSGAPAGTFTNLSAQNVNALRQQGIQTGTAIGQLLAGESFNLLGSEFQIWDQDFNLGYQIGLDRINAVSGANMQAAQSAGANWQAGGSFLTNIGSALVSYGTMGLSGQTANAPRAQVVGAQEAARYGVQQPIGAYPFMAPQTYQPMFSATPSFSAAPSYAGTSFMPSFNSGASVGVPDFRYASSPGINDGSLLPALNTFDNTFEPNVVRLPSSLDPRGYRDPYTGLFER